MWCKTCGYVLDGLSENRCPECSREFDPTKRRTFRRKPPWPRWCIVIKRWMAAIFLVLLAHSLVLYWRPLRETWAMLGAPWRSFVSYGSDPWTPTPYHAWYGDLARRYGIPEPRTLTDIDGWIRTTDADLAVLRSLPNLKGVNLDLGQITDEGMRDVVQLEKLWYLSLDRTLITDNGLARIGSLKNLRGVYISHTRITDEGLRHLKALPNLERLDLSGTKITDAGLAHIGALKNLRALDLSETSISDVGIENIQDLDLIRELNLLRTKITDDALATLQRLRSLSELNVSNTRITDAGLEHIKTGSRSLVELDVRGTDVTTEGIAGLKGHVFTIINEPRWYCKKCMYSLDGVNVNRCPGCMRAL
jgi:hypothetical protein